MAKRTDIAADIRKRFGGKNMLTITEVADYMGYKRTDPVKPFLSDIDCYNAGGQKKYLVIDIARKLDECKTLAGSVG